MDRPPPPRRARVLARGLPGLVSSAVAGAVVVAGVLAPLTALAAEPSPSPSPSARPGASPSAAPSASPSASPSPGASRSAARPEPRLPAPTVLGPVDDAPRKTVVLTWTPVPGAAGYVVEVGPDEQWSGEPVFTTDTVATRLTLPVPLPHASYVWRVAAKQATGHGRWSAAGSFTRAWTERPAPVSPVADSAVSGVGTFRWTPVPTASDYQLQVSTSPTFDERQPALPAATVDSDPTQTQNGPVTVSCFTSRTAITPHVTHGSQKLKGAGDCDMTVMGGPEPVFWRVRALDHHVGKAPVLPTTPTSDEGISHQPPSFVGNTVDLSACPEPAPSSPAPVAGPAAPAASPETSPSASTSPTSSPSAEPSPSASPSASPSPKGGGLSCAPKVDVEKGPWSPTTRFVMAFERAVAGDHKTLPPVRVQPLPADLCTAERVCRDMPGLRWDEVPGATSYRVYVSRDRSYSNLLTVADVLGTEWVPYVAYPDSTAGGAYHYAVQPCTPQGCGVVPADPPSFRKRSPAAEPLAPGDGAGANGDVVLSWRGWSETLAAGTGTPARSGASSGASSEAYAYRVQVTTDDDPDFQGELVEDVTVDETDHTSAEVSYPDGRLLWRVQAIDAGGHRLPWSTPRVLVRDATAPVATVSAATPTSVVAAVRIAFSEPVTDVSTGTVTLEPATPHRVTPALDGRSAEVVPLTHWVPGTTYAVRLSSGIADALGNPLAATAGAARIDPHVEDGSPALHYVGAWASRAASNASGGGFRSSTSTRTRNTAATVWVRGRGVVVTGCVGPASGMMDLYVHGQKRMRIDTYRSYSGCGVQLAKLPMATGLNQVQVRGVGVKRRASRGTTVMLDAVTALP